MKKHPIILKGARCHNLKGVDLELNPDELIVFTGISGSGKSSLAFDTLYTEGQRRYVESLSQFARSQLGELARPEVDHVEGLSPTISIEQKSVSKSPRSTVGTLTEIHDYLRVLYARVATPYCPVSGEAVRPYSREEILGSIRSLPEDTKLILLAPYAKGRKGEFKEEFKEFLRKGFMRVRVDGVFYTLDDPIPLDGSLAHTIDLVIDRLVLNPENDTRLEESLHTALEEGSGTCSIIYTEDGQETERTLSLHGFSPLSGLSYPPLEPQNFSFNTPLGMCPRCQGLGYTLDYDLSKIIDPELSINEDCCSIASSAQTVRYGNIYRYLSERIGFSLDTPWKKLSTEAQDAFLYGIDLDKKWTKMEFVHPVTGHSWIEFVRWQGVLHDARTRYAAATSDNYRKRAEEIMSQQTCPSCKGDKLQPYPAAAKFAGLTLPNLSRMPVGELLPFLENVTLSKQEEAIAGELLKEICARLRFLTNVGLHYLTLERGADSLSGGESQRIRLASQIGSGLCGVTYILDEPSIGLHPRDNTKLLETLKNLRDLGNTVIVVEHDEDTILAADRVVDFGPGAGHKGGELLVNGSLKELLKHKKSPTALYLSGKKEIPVPKKRRKGNGKKLILKGASHHNLKGIDVTFPLGMLIAVTGVSGSGKSSLIIDTLHAVLANKLNGAEHKVGAYKTIEGLEAIEKVIAVDQSPIGRNPRSNPSTYIKVFDQIRNLFTQLPEARARGYAQGRFSFNVKEGSCSRCGGMGMIKVDMDFLPDAWVNCPLCEGRRFDAETLSIRFKEKSIYDVLEMEVEEALPFFSAIPSIRDRLQLLEDVGMGYIKLGQPSPTLSGGEAQRVKLSKELSRPASEPLLYILDEPTTGLHLQDIDHLLAVLHKLVERGHTVLVIEHNMEVVKTADWVIDLGPEGGDEGGYLVAEGTPEKIAKMDTPTGRALKEALEMDRQARKGKASAKAAPKKSLQEISISKASQHNLKEVSLDVPRNKLTIFTGPSGAGKSSLAFDTLYAEGQRRYVESLSPYARQFVKQMDKPIVEKINGLLPAIAIEQKAHAGNPRSTVGTLTESYDYLRVLFARIGIPHDPDTGEVIEAISKETVVKTLMALPRGEKLLILAPLEVKKEEEFRNLLQRLKREGFLRIKLNKQIYELDQEEKIPFTAKLKNKLFVVVDRLKVDTASHSRLFEAVEVASRIGGGQLTVQHEEEELFFNLTFAAPSTGKSYPEITPNLFSFNTQDGMCSQCQGLGVLGGEEENGEGEEQQRKLSIDEEICPLCEGGRVNQLALHVTLDGFNLPAVCHWPITKLLEWVKKLKIPEEKQSFMNDVVKQLCGRLEFLEEVGLGYLSLDRKAPTLSGGEAQRIHLARQLGSQLKGTLYVLDEPTVGLHPKDNELLIKSLTKLKDLGNTLVVVEHDPQLIKAADLVVDFGPGSGQEGGHIVAEGTYADLLKNKASVTGRSLKEPNLKLSKKRKVTGKEKLTISKARLHNLKGFDVSFPAECFCCVTGVSGSGKSTLINELLKPAVERAVGYQSSYKSPHGTITGIDNFDQVVAIDQDPIGRTSRADLGTYCEIYPILRELFANVPAARALGLTPANFSFNHRRGMCTGCWGMGYKRIELHFLPPVVIPCPDCRGERLNERSRKIAYMGKTFGECLEMTVTEIKAHFSNHRKLQKICDNLIAVGLDYLKLGQRMQTLSGGEAQRVKLSRGLSSRRKTRTLYLMDEPSTGLHREEIKKLITVIQQLVDSGSTVIAIEHNLDLISQADYLVDLGPGAGDAGGHLLGSGTPTQLRQNPHSITAPFLP